MLTYFLSYRFVVQTYRTYMFLHKGKDGEVGKVIFCFFSSAIVLIEGNKQHG